MPTTQFIQGSTNSSTGTITLTGLTGLNTLMFGIFADSSKSQTYSGASLVLEGSNDGTNWAAIPVVRVDNTSGGSTTEAGTITLTDNEARAWQSQKPGTWTKARIRMTALGSGTISGGISTTANPTPTITAGPGEDLYTLGGRYYVTVAAGVGTADAPVAPLKARLVKVIVLTSGSAATSIYDNAATASGSEIFRVPANPTIGTVYTPEVATWNGITVGRVSNSSALCVTFTPLA